MKTTSYFHFAAALLLSLTTCLSLAQAHSDVLLVDVGGKVTIGAAEDIGGAEESFDTDTKVFETIMLPGFLPPVTPPDYQSDEPGFFGLHDTTDASILSGLGASALPASAAVSISQWSFEIDGATSDLFYWDGSGSVDFDPAPAGTDFTFNPGSFATTGANGDMDDHPLFEIDATSGTAANGVYLVSPVVDVAGLSTSSRFFMVFLVDSFITDEDVAEDVEHALEELEEGGSPDWIAEVGKDFSYFEEAVEYAEELLIPEPSSLLLGVAAFGLLFTKRNRRQVK